MPNKEERSLAEAHELVAADDRRDFEFAERGFIATRKNPKITRGDGRIAVDLSSYDFLDGPAPETANPSLWRQAQILTKHGLFKVAERIYQVRGFDVSTISFIDAGSGWIVVDPLTSVEPARAALSVAHEMSGFCSRRFVRFLEGFQRAGRSGCDPRYGCRDIWMGYSAIGQAD